MALEHRAELTHGMYVKEDGRIWWWQYHHTIVHTWYWHGIPVWWASRRRDRPTYELTRRIAGGW